MNASESSLTSSGQFDPQPFEQPLRMVRWHPLDELAVATQVNRPVVAMLLANGCEGNVMRSTSTWRPLQAYSRPTRTIIRASTSVADDRRSSIPETGRLL